MRFTKYNSLNDIMQYPNMKQYLKVFYDEYLLSFFSEEMSDKPLALVEHIAKTPWGSSFCDIVDQLITAVDMVLDVAENKKRTCISLWNPKDGEWTLEREQKGGREQVFLLAPTETPKRRRKAVLICPGGGYSAVCFSGEGTPMLRFMEAQGYAAFILKYRVSPNRYPDPQKDLVLAIKYLRANADKYQIDPNDILLIGSSAGGHLCALVSSLYDEIGEKVQADLFTSMPKEAEQFRLISGRPDKLCLCYPVISFQKEPHEGSFQELTGNDESLRKRLSAEELVTENYPPTFLWTCQDDDCVPPSNTVLMGEVLKEKGVPCEVNIYPSGGHGCALAFSKEASDWSSKMVEFFKEK